MGGKQKQAQRTKGNVKASSSARAAELLANTSGNPQGFVGFGAMSGDLGYVPAASGGEDVDNSIDAQFRLVLRKMSKRDATTKLKALQELSALCKEKDLDSIKSVLPFWPRIYNKMAIDQDRRVREATQQAFEQLIIRVCRNLAPHLKGLMGTWLVAQSDPYAPAASAAKAAFLRAFPPAKQSEAMVFCKEEVLNHLYENLLVHTAQTLSDTKTTEPEDIEAKYYRVVCASLTALKTLMATLPLEQQHSLQDKYRSMLSDAKFWKLGKHKQHMIVGSFYNVLSGFCHYHPSIAKDYSDKISPAILHNLDNMEPLVCATLWEAALYAVSVLEDCWKHVNPRKGVLPKLWSLLKQGGSGNATVIYPNLLPFLNHIPTEVLGHGVGFYNEFFSNLKIGLTQLTCVQSVTECSAVVSAFMECLQHVLSRNLDNQPLTECLVTEHLVSLLGSTLLEDGQTISSTSMFSTTVDLLIFLHQETSKDSKNLQFASAILKQIVESIKELRIIEIGNDKILARYSMFLQSFKKSGKTSKIKKKSSKVMFTDDKGTPPISEKVENFYKPLVEENGLLHPVICEACRAAYKKSLADNSLGNLVFFSQIFTVYASDTLAEKVWDQSDPLLILKDCVSPWMAALGSGTTGEKLQMHQAFVEILLTLFNICTVEEKTKLLSSALEDIPDMAVFQKFAQAVYIQSSDDAVRNWFKGPKFGERMVAVTRELCTQSCGDKAGDTEFGVGPDVQWDLLSLAFTVDDKIGEPLLGEMFVTRVLQEILDSLPNPTKFRTLPQGQISRCVAFVCDVATNFFDNIKGCLLLPPAEELLFALFQISCQQTLVSDSVMEKVERTWHRGVKSLFLQSELSPSGTNITEATRFMDQQHFLQKAAAYIKGLVCSEAKFERLQRLVTVSRSLIRCVQSGVDQSETDNFTAESEEGHSQHDLHQQKATVNQMVQALYQDLLTPFVHDALPEWNVGTLVSHDLPSVSMDTKIVDASPPTACPRCVLTITFTSELMVDKLKINVTNSRTVSDPVPPETKTEAPSEVLSHVDESLVLDMWYGSAFCEAMVKPRVKAYASTEFGQVHKLLHNNIAFISKNIPLVARNKIMKGAWDRSMSVGGLWSICLQNIANSMDNASILQFVRSVGGSDSLQSLERPALETLYVLLPQLSTSDMRQLVEIHAAMLQTSQLDDLARLSGHVSVVSRFLTLQDPVATSEQDPEGYDFDPEVMLGVLDQIQAWKDTQNDLFLFDSLVKSADWNVVSFNTEVLYFLCAVITKMPTKLPEKSWDFILCSLVEWVQSCNESKQVMTSDPKTAMFAIATLKLLTATAQCMEIFKSSSSGGLPPNLYREWKEFFSAGTYNLVVPLFVFIAEKSPNRKLNTGHELLLQSLSTAVGLCPVDHVTNHQLPAKLIAGDSSSLPVEQQTALNHLCPLLLSPNRAIQLGAHKLLMTLLPELVQDDDDQETSDALEEKQPRSPPKALMSVLDTAYEGAHLLLGDISMDEPIVLESHGDEYTVTMGYLLCWNLVLAYVRNAEVELRAEYAYYLRDHDKMNMLMPCLIKLMPSSPLVPLGSKSLDERLSGASNLFEEEPQLSAHEEAVGEEVRHMACFVYFHVVQDLPAVLRQWYNDQDKRVSALVNRYTSKYVSPLMCSKEIKAIQRSDRVLDNMTIKTRSVTREVVATYSLEEISIELVVTLPTNHPLGPMTIECGKRIGVANTQWRTWMLQLTTFLHKQNGSILDGLGLWKRNVDKRFEGVEECMICFSVIHGSNFQVPKLQCKTCKKRFHSACLYKWFSTSNNSSCPLCRNLF